MMTEGQFVAIIATAKGISDKIRKHGSGGIPTGTLRR